MWALPFVASAAMDLFGGYGTKAGHAKNAQEGNWVHYVHKWAAEQNPPIGYHEALKGASHNGLREAYYQDIYGTAPPPLKQRSKPQKKYVYHRGHAKRGQVIENGPLSAADYWATHGKRGKGKRQVKAQEYPPEDFVLPQAPQPPPLLEYKAEREGKRRDSLPALEVPPEELQFLPASQVKREFKQSRVGRAAKVQQRGPQAERKFVNRDKKLKRGELLKAKAFGVSRPGKMFQPGVKFEPVTAEYNESGLREQVKQSTRRGPEISKVLAFGRSQARDIQRQGRAQVLAGKRAKVKGKGGKLRGSGISLREWNEANG